ncbi:EamA family transporter RarD [Selenomonas sp. TAMA-11512]|uniref:EamA family transporter RarD n=1 Tax=Selenomonas sp. TAMA-11512 TaxID=3095337 RepID=UPI00308844B3|nr:EamA family transporter RarD [Selenomonas sp. TAMA-11512]
MTAFQKGTIAIFATYVMWGFFPLYWRLMESVDSMEILAQRMVWCFIFMLFVITAKRSRHGLADACRGLLRQRTRMLALFSAAIFISLNWLTFIWAVNHDHVVDCGIGYYINPLVTIAFGVIFFRERLTPTKKLCIVLAAIGIFIMTVQTGTLPYIAPVLAFTFGAYGAVKKKLQMNPIHSIMLETAILAPIALLYSVYLIKGQVSTIDFDDVPLLFVIAGMGAVTTVPLMLFSYGANLLPLNVIGFLQYISPTLQLLLGIFFFQEPFTVPQFAAMSFIWAALLLFTLSESLRHR